MTIPTIAARHAHAILDAAAHQGVDTRELLAAAAIDAVSLRAPDARVPLAAHERLWNAAVRLTGDEAFGIRIGASLQHGRYGVVEPLVHASATVGAAIERFMRLERLSVDGAVTTVMLTERAAHISHGPRLPTFSCSPYGIEMTLMAFLAVSRGTTGVAITPRAVRLRRAAPADRSVHDALFGARVQFRADDDTLVLDRNVFDLPIRTADPGLADALDRYFTQQLAKLPPLGDEAFTPRVLAWLRHAVAHGDADIAAASKALAASERTLQRKLKAEGTSFALLTDAVRRELALAHARDTAVSLDVVAVLAGFSEKSAFYRAFRRWTGVTPAVYRSQAHAA